MLNRLKIVKISLCFSIFLIHVSRFRYFFLSEIILLDSFEQCRIVCAGFRKLDLQTDGFLLCVAAVVKVYCARLNTMKVDYKLEVMELLLKLKQQVLGKFSIMA